MNKGGYSLAKAVWGIDYDYRTDKQFRRPMCRRCHTPLVMLENGKTICTNCGITARIQEDMRQWLEARRKTKLETKDCIARGCGGKNCVDVTYVKNPVTLEWQVSSGYCRECGARFIV